MLLGRYDEVPHSTASYNLLNVAQSFTESTDVILLTTNLFKKEFSSSSNNQYEIGMAINCLANIATKDLARDCISDLVVLMNHSRAYVRKKAVLAMFKLYVKFPQGLRLTFEKLKDRLDDSESSVISTAVNVICELANKNPRNYLAMAPKFFRLLTTSSNNWMLIKVVKLLGSLVSEEPRLGACLPACLPTNLPARCLPTYLPVCMLHVSYLLSVHNFRFHTMAITLSQLLHLFRTWFEHSQQENYWSLCLQLSRTQARSLCNTNASTLLLLLCRSLRERTVPTRRMLPQLSSCARTTWGWEETCTRF